MMNRYLGEDLVEGAVLLEEATVVVLSTLGSAGLHLADQLIEELDLFSADLVARRCNLFGQKRGCSRGRRGR